MAVNVSGFTFVHNALEGGYPIVEAVRAVQPHVDEVVAADMESDDGTRRVLRRLGVRVIEGVWDGGAGETLARAHALNAECGGEIVVHFEADEVYDDWLLCNVRKALEEGHRDVAVHRLQLEQNFQRCRWYPEPVHRVFPRGSAAKVGHTTDRHGEALLLPPEAGLLWDITNCFRDNWLRRVRVQAELWNEEPRYRMVPFHFLREVELTKEQAEAALAEPHWTWTATPFDLPEILKPLVGVTRYEARL